MSRAAAVTATSWILMLLCVGALTAAFGLTVWQALAVGLTLKAYDPLPLLAAIRELR